MFASLTQASFLKLFPGAMRLGGVAALWAMAWCVAAQGDVNLTEGVDAENLDAVAFIPIADMLANTANDLASWYDEEEDQTYLLVGCDNGTAFFKMLPGARPLYMGKLPPSRSRVCGATSKSFTTTRTSSAKRPGTECRCWP